MRTKQQRDTCLSEGTSRVAKCHQNPGEKHEITSPSEPPVGTNPTDTLGQTSSLQNCERIHFCCQSRATLANQYNPSHAHTSDTPVAHTFRPLCLPFLLNGPCFTSPPAWVCFTSKHQFKHHVLCRKPSLTPLTPGEGSPDSIPMLSVHNTSTANQ